MLFAFEGGFFSSSSSGFRDGLDLLLVGCVKERSKRVSPWARYHLVGPRVVSKKSKLFRKWAMFICSGCASAPREVPGQRPSEADDENCGGNLRLKSSLKRQADFLVLTDGVKVDAGCVDQRRVHWRDASGSDLAEVKEFAAGEDRPSDEDQHGSDGIRKCGCVIQ